MSKHVYCKALMWKEYIQMVSHQYEYACVMKERYSVNNEKYVN